MDIQIHIHNHIHIHINTSRAQFVNDLFAFLGLRAGVAADIGPLWGDRLEVAPARSVALHWYKRAVLGCPH